MINLLYLCNAMELSHNVCDIDISLLNFLRYVVPFDGAISEMIRITKKEISKKTPIWIQIKYFQRMN